MKKQLTDMSLEELWELFPIILTAHQACWSEWFEEEKQLLEEYLPADKVVRLSHIGSSAIEGIWAKPTVDMLLEVKEGTDFEEMKHCILTAGYLLMSAKEARMSFNKGYTLQGFAERVFHLHLRYEGDNDELYFRDYLRIHPEVAKVYEKLKLSLWKPYQHNRDGYTEAKEDFVRKYTEIGKKEMNINHITDKQVKDKE